MRLKNNSSASNDLPTLPPQAHRRLPGESTEDYLKFLAYAARSAEIAAQLTRLNLPLNGEIFPAYTCDLEQEMICTAYRWRERVPSWFIHVGNRLARTLTAD